MQDCCHAFGAEWKGRMIGTSGDVAVYAFNISKIMTSIFGGMLTFQDQELADRLRAWRDDLYKPAHWFKALQRRLYLLAVYFAFNERVYGLTAPGGYKRKRHCSIASPRPIIWTITSTFHLIIWTKCSMSRRR